MDGIVVAGAGGVGREVLGIAAALGLPVGCFVDPRLTGAEVRGLAVLDQGRVPAGARYVVAIASADARRAVSAQLDALGAIPQSLIHPAAIVAPATTFRNGAIVMGGAHVSTEVVAGAHVQVHYNATVGHDAVLGDFTTVLPGANVSGDVRLGEGATVGSGAVVLQGRAVGRDAFVGAGAVVTRDVPDGEVWVGSPARRLER